MDPQHGLNILDYSVLGIVLLSGLLALMRGFIREVFSLAAWVGAYFAAAKYYGLAEPWTHRYVKNQTGATALAAIIVFCVALTALALVGHLLAKLIRGRALTAIDRSLGFLFGLLRGVLIVCLLYLGASYIPWLNMDKLDESAQAKSAEPPVEQAKEDDKNRDRDKPPIWLIESKTRPALAAGANALKVFIPEKEIEKTMQQYDDQKVKAHNAIDEQTHDILGMPAAGSGKQENPPAYDDKSRSNLDNLIIQKGKP
jgi:membrane protein required for colicin V production